MSVVPISHGRRCAFLGIVLAATSGCSLLVSTSGLTGGDGGVGGGLPVDDAGTLTTEGGEARSDDAGAGSGDDEAGVASASDASNEAGGNGGADGGADAGREAGPTDAGSGGKSNDGGCTDDLSNVGTGDFQITLTLRTTQSGEAAILNQRSSCSPGVFWDLRLVNGQPDFELDGTSGYCELVASGPDLNDGASHTIVVARVSGMVTIVVDGTAAGTSTNGSGVSLTALPPLAEGSDVCDGVNGDGGDGTVAIPGAVSNVCVSPL